MFRATRRWKEYWFMTPKELEDITDWSPFQSSYIEWEKILGPKYMLIPFLFGNHSRWHWKPTLLPHTGGRTIHLLVIGCKFETMQYMLLMLVERKKGDLI